MKSTFIPDASVILKWVFNSPDKQDAEKALGILKSWVEGKCDILLPKLWAFEARNVLGLKNPAMACVIMEILLGYGFAEE